MTIHEERLCSLDTIAARASQPFMHTFTLGILIRYFIRKYITGIAIHQLHSAYHHASKSVRE